MKWKSNSNLAVSIRSAVVTFVLAMIQTAFADVNLNPPQGTNTYVPPGSATISAIGPNSRTWSLPPDTNLLSMIATNSTRSGLTNSHQVVEVATGMNYWNGQQWQPSVAVFQSSVNGFAASQTQHKIQISANLNQIGAVLAVTPEGTNLSSSPIGIALYDAASGNLAIIGTITNCSGTQTASNVVVFPDAFNGVCANVVYTMEKGAFHQDVMLTGAINPADYGFPTNTTRIQVITEFYNPPTPERIVRPIHVEQNPTARNQMANPDLMDEMLGFGHFTFGAGRAYLAPKISNTDPGAPVGKQLLNVNGRMLLVESVDYKSIWRGMASLPICNAGSTNSPGGTSGGLGGIKRKTGKGNEAYAGVPVPPKGGSSAAAVNPASVPKGGVASIARAGLVIDYTVDTGSMDDTSLFQSDTTYFVSGALYCDGATTIEGGAVFKYPLAVGDFSSGTSITMGNALTLITSSYRPAIFTAADDDSAGSKMNTGPYASYYTGNPGAYYNTGSGYGWPYLSLACAVGTLNHLHFCYAQEALYINGVASSAPVTVAHSQFVNCIQGIELDSGSGATLTLNNCLFHNVQYVITDEGSESDAYYLCNCTVHQTSNTVTLMTSDSGPPISCVNSVFANITESATTFSGYNNGFYNSTVNGSDYSLSYVYPFSTAISGAHYLNPASGFVGAGTTNIDTNLLASLRNMTTVAPPVVLSNVTFVENFNLYPQVSRDTKPATVDLGYHYDPVDFLVNHLTVSNGNTLNLVSGVAVATYGSVGINFLSGTSLNSAGSPITRNVVTQTRAVQESPDVWTSDATYSPFAVSESTGVDMRFTDVTFLPRSSPSYNDIFSNTIPALLLLQDCRISGAGFLFDTLAGDTASPSMQLHNTLFERCYFLVSDQPAVHDLTAVSASVDWNNDLFFGCALGVTHSVGTWTVRDNIFDTSSITDSSTSTITHNHNAYVNMSSSFSGTDTGSYSLSSFGYDTGPLGAYYQPSGSSLRNHGSRSAADAGLYHYTVGTNQTKEASSTVTIGLHYVALNSSGKPDDYDGDGLADYFEDTNGDGSYTSGIDISDWTHANTGSSSDGVSDLIKLLQGRTINTSTLPVADTSPNLKVYTPLSK